MNWFALKLPSNSRADKRDAMAAQTRRDSTVYKYEACQQSSAQARRWNVARSTCHTRTMADTKRKIEAKNILLPRLNKTSLEILQLESKQPGGRE